MTTLLEVIERTKEKMNYVIQHHDELFKEIKTIVNDNDLKNIVLIGSGSSYSSALSAMLFVEKASGLNVSVMLPNLFLEKSVYDNETLYVFVSQSGTSSLTLQAALLMKEQGRATLALSGIPDSPIAKACRYYIEIAAGYEEYTYATLGYSLSLFTEMMLGIHFGIERGICSKDLAEQYLAEAETAAINNKQNIERTIDWFEREKETLLAKQNFVIYGGKTLYGIANEGCLKIMEITKKYVSVPYELDDGMHGPNYCLDERSAVFVLNDGKDSDKCMALMNLMKKEYQSGYIAGKAPMDSHDLELCVQTDDFSNLELVSFAQTLAYLLAKENNVPIYMRDDPRLQKTKGKGYFNMHL